MAFRNVTPLESSTTTDKYYAWVNANEVIYTNDAPNELNTDHIAYVHYYDSTLSDVTGNYEVVAYDPEKSITISRNNVDVVFTRDTSKDIGRRIIYVYSETADSIKNCKGQYILDRSTGYPEYSATEKVGATYVVNNQRAIATDTDPNTICVRDTVYDSYKKTEIIEGTPLYAWKYENDSSIPSRPECTTVYTLSQNPSVGNVLYGDASDVTMMITVGQVECGRITGLSNNAIKWGEDLYTRYSSRDTTYVRPSDADEDIPL